MFLSSLAPTFCVARDDIDHSARRDSQAESTGAWKQSARFLFGPRFARTDCQEFVLWELIQRGCISLESSDAESRVHALQDPRSPAITVRIYEHLAMLNTGFDQVRRSLAALARYREFDRPTLLQFSERAEEARAATNSYLASVIEAAETAEAGRRFGKRRASEEAEEGTERG